MATSDQTKLERFAVHVYDNMGTLNEALNAGEITMDQWREMVAAIAALTEKFDAVFPPGVTVYVRRAIDKTLDGGEK